MNKKKFIDELHFVHKNTVSNIYDKIALAGKIEKTVYTNEFYTPNIWKKIENMKNELELNVFSCGIFEDAERKMMAFSKHSKVLEYPIDLLRITLNSRFSKLYHKDYLGSIMSLGLKREKFGDLILKENRYCYLACSKNISKYIESNFDRVGNSHCIVDILDLNTAQIPNYNFKSIIKIVSSMRADCIVSSLCNLSRKNSEMLIKGGKLQVDYSEYTKKDGILDCDSTITVRGYGKFKLAEKVGFTGKGKIKLLIKKFS